MMNYLIMATSIALAITGQMLMKRGMMSFGTFPVSQLLVNVIPMFLNPWVFSGLVCFGLSSVFWLVVLSRLPLSLVYPMVSIGYIIVALLSMIFFKENVSFIRWGGIAVIVLGVILISRS
jgi:multidrug transporter EmrE-like cation transporter